MARMYVRSITRSSNYVPKSPTLLAGTGVWKISSVASGLSINILIIQKVQSA